MVGDERVGKFTDDQLYRIADAPASNAGFAISILRTAASTADRHNCARISEDILEEAARDVRAQIKQKSLDSLIPATISCASTACWSRVPPTTATRARAIRMWR